MRRSSRVRLTMHVAAAFLLVSLVSCNEASHDRPHVVLILADDMGYGDPGCYNEASRIPTPRIDEIAAEGMRLTDAHSPSAVCTPTRYGILTGRYSWRTPLKSGVLWGYSPLMIDTQRVTLPELLRRNGYTTAGFGKWHLGLGAEDSTDYFERLSPGPNDVGFDVWFGIPASLDMDPYVYFENDRVLEAPTDTVAAGAPTYEEGGPYWRAGPAAPGFRHIDVLPRTTARAVSFIEDNAASGSEEPFFLYIPFSAPHTPWLPTEPYEGTSEAGGYGDFTAMVDASVGQIVDALNEHDLAGRTLLVVTSDNGSYWPEEWIPRWEHRSNGSWRGMKADIWEGGHRVPFIARWPGSIAPGTESEAIFSLVDLMSTIAAAADIPLPAQSAEDSYNLLPVLLGDGTTDEGRDVMIMHSSRGVFAIREGPWKLIEGLGSGGFTEPAELEPVEGDPPGQLYHLGDDPGETNNIWEEHPDVVNRLLRLLAEHRDRGYSRPGAVPADQPEGR